MANDKLNDAVEAVAQARADVLETMLHGNDTLVEYYGSAGGNGAWERDRERCKRENEAQLDALIAAVRAECAAKVNPAPLTPFGEMVVKAVDGLQERIITAINDGRHTKGERSGLRMASAMVGELRRDLLVEAQP